MKKTTLVALEKVFAAEIDGSLPFQSRAKIYSQLCEDGLLAPMQRTFGTNTRLSITVSGYQLTDAGRIIFCESCRNVEDA